MSRKQTILSVPFANREHPSDQQFRAVIRHAYSIDGYSPVLVTIRIGNDTAVFHTTSLPGGGWWREPNASSRRYLLDEALAKHNMIRTGTVETTTADQWFHRYPIRALNTPSPECPIRSVVHDEHVFKHIGRMDDPSTGAHIDCPGR